MIRLCYLAAILVFASGQDVGGQDLVEEVVLNFTCPEPYGIFGDPEQCDLYWECFEGQATYKLCDDGLVYDDKLKTVTTEPCDTMDNVDCGNRIYLQPESGTWPCLRKNGLYPYPEDNVCNKFVTCTYNKYSYTSCPSGLYYSKLTKGCTWPADSGRTGCVQERIPSEVGGFVCPNEAQDSTLQAVAHTLHADDSDCRKFYICINREVPRQAACDLGKVFSLETKICELPQKVPECLDYYVGHPELEGQLVLQEKDFPVGGHNNPGRNQDLVRTPAFVQEGPVAPEAPTSFARKPMPGRVIAAAAPAQIQEPARPAQPGRVAIPQQEEVVKSISSFQRVRPTAIQDPVRPSGRTRPSGRVPARVPAGKVDAGLATRRTFGRSKPASIAGFKTPPVGLDAASFDTDSVPANLLPPGFNLDSKSGRALSDVVVVE